MANDKDSASGRWILLSQMLGEVPEAEMDAALKRIREELATRHRVYRYLDVADPLTYPRTGHRYDPLDPDFFRLGRINWLFSAVTFPPTPDGRTVRELEVFIPDVAEDPPLEPAAVKRAALAAEPPRSVEPQEPAPADPYRTGAPGRPTPAHLVLAETERRLTSGEPLPAKLEEFAHELAEWLRDAHRDAPTMTPKTIENVVRKLWNARNK